MKKKPLVSIIIANYNNAKYLDQCINSILKQTYKFFEIIVVDDGSSDNSIKKLKNYKKKINLIVNKKKKSRFGSYNQMNSYYLGFLKSCGDLIFFLDSDDYFHQKKIEILVKKFHLNNNIDLIFDLPILVYEKKKEFKIFKQKKFIFSSWPRFTPQSCISGRKTYIKDLFEFCMVNKFNSIWFDFRIATFTFLKFKRLNIINEYLTYYRQLDFSASKNWKKFSKNWWFRRVEAHNFYSYACVKLNIKDKLSLDKLITKLIFFFIK